MEPNGIVIHDSLLTSCQCGSRVFEWAGNLHNADKSLHRCKYEIARINELSR